MQKWRKTGLSKTACYDQETCLYRQHTWPERTPQMAHMNLLNLYQDKFQDIQDLRDQYMAMQKCAMN